MKPRRIIRADLDYWAQDSAEVTVGMFTAPAEIEAGVEPCEGVITAAADEFGQAVRVPWTLDEIDLAHLARGGTLWLSTWGGLPMHQLEVQAPPEAGRGG